MATQLGIASNNTAVQLGTSNKKKQRGIPNRAGAAKYPVTSITAPQAPPLRNTPVDFTAPSVREMIAPNAPPNVPVSQRPPLVTFPPLPTNRGPQGPPYGRSISNPDPLAQDKLPKSITDILGPVQPVNSPPGQVSMTPPGPVQPAPASGPAQPPPGFPNTPEAMMAPDELARQNIRQINSSNAATHNEIMGNIRGAIEKMQQDARNAPPVMPPGYNGPYGQLDQFQYDHLQQRQQAAQQRMDAHDQRLAELRQRVRSSRPGWNPDLAALVNADNPQTMSGGSAPPTMTGLNGQQMEQSGNMDIGIGGGLTAPTYGMTPQQRDREATMMGILNANRGMDRGELNSLLASRRMPELQRGMQVSSNLGDNQQFQDARRRRQEEEAMRRLTVNAGESAKREERRDRLRQRKEAPQFNPMMSMIASNPALAMQFMNMQSRNALAQQGYNLQSMIAGNEATQRAQQHAERMAQYGALNPEARATMVNGLMQQGYTLDEALREVNGIGSGMPNAQAPNAAGPQASRENQIPPQLRNNDYSNNPHELVSAMREQGASDEKINAALKQLTGRDSATVDDPDGTGLNDVLGLFLPWNAMNYYTNPPGTLRRKFGEFWNNT